MLSKDQVAAQYALNGNGRIASLGKFQGEPWWVVALWDLALEGCADGMDDDEGVEISIFNLDPELAAITGYRSDATSGRKIIVWETDSGFVCHNVVSAHQ
jgi:hypothetical protein